MLSASRRVLSDLGSLVARKGIRQACKSRRSRHQEIHFRKYTAEKFSITQQRENLIKFWNDLDECTILWKGGVCLTFNMYLSYLQTVFVYYVNCICLDISKKQMIAGRGDLLDGTVLDLALLHGRHIDGQRMGAKT